MALTVAFEDAPGEARFGWFEDARLVALRLERNWEVRGGAGLSVGQAFGAYVRDKSRQGRGTVELTSELQAHVRPAPSAPEGALITVEITHEPLPEPGQIKPARARHLPGVQTAKPGWLGEGAAVDLALARSDEPMVCANAHSLARAHSAGRQARLAGDGLLFDTMDAALDALDDPIPFVGGALTLERSRAGLVIDVDASAAPLEANCAAAQRIAELLRLYGIGGAVLIDFVGMATKAERAAVVAAFDQAAGADPMPCERTSINGYGLMQVVRPRRSPSVIDQICGTRRQGPSVETRALRLLRQVGRCLGAQTLTVQPMLAERLMRWPQTLDETGLRTGGAIRLITHPMAPEAGEISRS
jgi:ribonuclease G